MTEKEGNQKDEGSIGKSGKRQSRRKQTSSLEIHTADRIPRDRPALTLGAEGNKDVTTERNGKTA